MSKKKGVPGYPASQLRPGDVIYIRGLEFVVYGAHQPTVSTVRLIRKANGPTYATWQRRTSKLLKAMGLSRWPGVVMHEYFFNSVSPEDAAAGFMADHFLAP